MEQVGTLLWEMRTAAGFSLGSLARKAGVGKAALSQWENGKRQPRVAELEAVLDALGADAARRALVFARIEAPRALRYLRQTAPVQGPAAPPTVNNLLSALRLRQGYSQERVAARLGVTRHAVSQWERGDRMPSPEHVQALCYALGAQEEEVVALTCGHFPQPPTACEEKTVDALAGDVKYYWQAARPRSDLEYLALILRAWRVAVQEEAARSLLARCYLMYADYLALRKRWPETERYTESALRLMPDRTSCEPFWVMGGVIAAHHAVYGGRQPASERGLHILQRWLPQAQDSIYRSWIEARRAEYLLLADTPDAAVAQGAQARRTVEKSEALYEIRMRRKDQGMLLVKASFPAEALSLLQPDPEEEETEAGLDSQLWQVKAYLALGERLEAHSLLQQVQTKIIEKRLSEMQPSVDELAQQF